MPRDLASLFTPDEQRDIEHDDRNGDNDYGRATGEDASSAGGVSVIAAALGKGEMG